MNKIDQIQPLRGFSNQLKLDTYIFVLKVEEAVQFNRTLVQASAHVTATTQLYVSFVEISSSAKCMSSPSA